MLWNTTSIYPIEAVSRSRISNLDSLSINSTSSSKFQPNRRGAGTNACWVETLLDLSREKSLGIPEVVPAIWRGSGKCPDSFRVSEPRA